MKKTVCLITVLTLIICLCACSKAESNLSSESQTQDGNNYTEYYNYKTDCQFGITNPIAHQFVTKGENCYYVVNNDGYIIFADMEQGEGTYLCNKPNCLHNNHDCYAYAESAEDIAYNDGYIYYLYESSDDDSDDGTSIKRMATDGSGKREVVYNCEKQIYNWIIHRGKLYITTCEYNPKNKDDNNEATRMKLFSVSVDDSKNQEIIYDSKKYLDFGSFDYLSAFDTYLYYSIDYQNAKEKEVTSLNCYDIENGTTNEVLLPDKKSCSTPYIYPFLDKLVFKYKSDIYSCNLDSSNVQKIMTLDDEYHNIFSDGTYLYEDNYANYLFSDVLSIDKAENRTLKVYDNNINNLDTLNIKDYEKYFCPCDDKYFICVDDDNNISYFDKSQIGNINSGEWKENELNILD